MPAILVIDDDTDICLLLKRYLEKNNHRIETAFSLKKGLDAFKAFKPDVVLCDFRLPDGEGLEAIQRFKAIDPEVQVIIMTGYSDVKVAIDCIKRGAFDYVTKPIHPEEILHTILSAKKHQVNAALTDDAGRSEEVSSKKRKQRDTSNKKRQTRSSKPFIEGESPQSKQVVKLINLVAPTDMSIVVIGETGTGKEYVAKRIHARSERNDQPFLAIDCGALPKEIAASELFGHKKGAFTGALQDKTGAFEAADGGTLFLDEVANLSYDNQVKLLRVLQERTIRRIGEERERKVNVRIIAATNEDLRNKAQDGAFREDLFHRLNEFNITLSPLRERSKEIKQFAAYFLEQSNESLSKEVQSFDPETMEILLNHPWPGNLRELKNVVKRATLLAEGKKIVPMNVPVEIREGSVVGGDDDGVALSHSVHTLKEATEAAERALILRTLERTDYNKSKTAKLLDVDRKTLYNKAKAYAINLSRRQG
jgi:two-component system response regulator HydG